MKESENTQGQSSAIPSTAGLGADTSRAHELRVFKVLDPRRNEMLYFVRLKDAIRTAENCSMIYKGTALMHTGHPMPYIDGYRPEAPNKKNQGLEPNGESPAGLEC